MTWYDLVKTSYHHIKHHIFWHQLCTVACFMWQIQWRHWFFKAVTLLNSGHASCLTCSNLSSTSNRLWVCALQMGDWFISTGTLIDGQNRYQATSSLWGPLCRENVAYYGNMAVNSVIQESSQAQPKQARLQRRGWGVSHPWTCVMT